MLWRSVWWAMEQIFSYTVSWPTTSHLVCYVGIPSLPHSSTKKLTISSMNFILIASLLGTLSVTTFTEQTDAFLSDHVSAGKVDYAGISQDRGQIDELYQQIGEMSLKGTSDAEKKAFYINAYNIITIRQIVAHYPVKSPMDVKGFFDQKKHTVAGEQFTLNELEKKKLLEPYQDPRVHFVLVCAAVSCPPLANFAYRADKLDEQLDEKTQQALNSGSFVRVSRDQKKVELSKIFEWYNSDFTRDSPSLIAYVNQYRDQKIPSGYQVRHYEYNWQLNNQ